jgi:hypothetical protein
MKSRWIAVGVWMFASIAVAQQLSIGNMPIGSPVTVGDARAPVTFIDLAYPATTNGTINFVTLRWSRPCDNAVKIKVLRNFSIPLGQFSVVAERGPFSVVNGRFSIPLTPPIDVLKGDVLAIVQLQPLATCGTIQQSGSASGLTAFIGNEVKAPAVTSATILSKQQLSAIAGNDLSNFVAGVIPAAGALAGSNNSFFRTAIQLQSGDGATIAGRFVFHPAGKAAAASDPSMPFTIVNSASVSYSDLITQMGQSGLGSLDIITTGGSTPVVTARVFNDNGSGGTQGFTEEMVRPADALTDSTRSILPFPADPTNFRMNIGVRTLAASSIRFSAMSADGVFLGSVTKSYVANFFEQPGAQALLGLASLPVNGYVVVTVDSGSCIVYASYTDNRTNDSTIKYVGQ